MAQLLKVNDKIVIKKVSMPKYFHCFKLSESSYALFDIKMDMPLMIGSIAIIKSLKLPSNSIVFYYHINDNKGYFEKMPEKTIDVQGEGTYLKPPLRYHHVNDKKKFYHVFKLTPILFVLWDDDVSMPIAYGSYQRIQATLNIIPKDATVFYYKEDASVKHSFKFYTLFEGKKQSKL